MVITSGSVADLASAWTVALLGVLCDTPRFPYLGVEIWNGYFRIENDDGAWQQQPMIQSVKRGQEPDPMTSTAVFEGEEAYEGLITIMGITRSSGGWDVEGVIMDAVLPPTPEVRDFYD